ncbi:acyl-CoA-like ligand-binding transcription factor [Streptomyces sp. NPDC001617]
MLQQDREALLLRTRLTFNDPALRARNVAEQERSERAMAEVIAGRTGRDPTDLEVRCAAAAIIAVFTRWYGTGWKATGRRTWRGCTSVICHCCHGGWTSEPTRVGLTDPPL